MSKALNDVLAANRKYSAEFGQKGTLGMPPASKFAILTCMDARLDPVKFAGLAEGDAHVIRRVHPLIPRRSIPIYGFIYDVSSGKLIEVEQANDIGKAA